jgi:hypothetical protein
MKHFRQGSFYYRQNENGRYLQVFCSPITNGVSITEVSESVAMFTSANNPNEEISAIEFSMALEKALASMLITIKGYIE